MLFIIQLEFTFVNVLLKILFQETAWYQCKFENCTTKNPCEMLCIKCNKHFCLAHRHHGCLDELPGKEAKRVLREAAKKLNEQFAITKGEADKKVHYFIRINVLF